MKRFNDKQPRKKSIIYREIANRFIELAEYEEWKERQHETSHFPNSQPIGIQSPNTSPALFAETPDTAIPARCLKELLCQPWFDKVCSDPKRYDQDWRQQWIDALMASQSGSWIASDWAVAGRRLKVKCMVVGRLCDSGVLAGNYSLVARHMGIERQDPATLAKYMGLKKNSR